MGVIGAALEAAFDGHSGSMRARKVHGVYGSVLRSLARCAVEADDLGETLVAEALCDLARQAEADALTHLKRVTEASCG